MPQKSIPSPVERYVKEIAESNSDYTDAQVWATAWSIYCKYKNPGSEHCTKPASDYFPGKGGPLMLRRDYGNKVAKRVALRYALNRG
jgi:hypothetical protein